jgi:hypothetical protein
VELIKLVENLSTLWVAVIGDPIVAEEVVASVKPSPKWERIEVQRAESSDYSMVIWCKAATAN